MSSSNYLGSSSDNFSLPSGFFQNPGSGKINSGLKPANVGANFSNNRGVRPNPPKPNPNPNPTLNNPNSQPIQYTRSLPLADGRYPTNPNPGYNPNYRPNPSSVPPPNTYPQQKPLARPQLAVNNYPPTPPLPQRPVNVSNHQIHHAQIEHQRLMAESQAHITRENHYTNTLLIGILGLFLYFVGAFIIIFTSNVGGQTIVNLPTYKLSWELLFSDPSQLINNTFLTIFGYFFQYARLFGFFPELGNLTVDPVDRYLMPVDILIKLGTILYFNFRWMPWDTKRTYDYGCFNSKYPYLGDDQKITTKKDIVSSSTTNLASINIPAAELEKMNQPVENKPQVFETMAASPINSNLDEENDEEETDHGILPFSGVQKPIEEWYYENETKIYSFIRTQILPGSNMVLALYFSTLSVLDLRQPAFILFYILGIMSMFWCMQTFLLILDHTQYPPDEG